MSGFVELIMEQGADFSSSINVKDASGVSSNLTSYTAASQMRKSHYSSTSNGFTVTIPTPLTGNISMSMSHINTANISPGRYVFDLMMTSPDSIVTRVMEGIITVLPNVTR